MQQRAYATPAGDGQITFVKKILKDGGPCRKCNEVNAKLEENGYMKHIDKIVYAMEADPQSEGMVLAAKYKLNRAPFFLVDKKDGTTDVYPVYMKFVKAVFGTRDLEEEKKERLREGSESAVDFI
jgi:hypothetical protein